MCAIYFWYRRYIIVVQMAHIYKNFPANFEEIFFEITIFFVPFVCKSFCFYKYVVNMLKLLFPRNNVFYAV